MMIAFPPCTYLSYAAIRVWNSPGRAELRNAALEFFKNLYNAPIEKIAIENPVGWVNVAFRKPDQIIHPYYFGDLAHKRTCLWLKNLPLLQHFTTNDLFNERTHINKPAPVYFDKKGKPIYFVGACKGGKERAKIRAKTFPGIARAMAEQWYSIL
jgi:hypothetical protein